MIKPDLLSSLDGVLAHGSTGPNVRNRVGWLMLLLTDDGNVHLPKRGVRYTDFVRGGSDMTEDIL